MGNAKESDWIAALRQEHARLKSLLEVGQKIGYSSAVVSTVLSGKYRGDLQRVEKAVRTHLMGQLIECPGQCTCCGHRCGRPVEPRSPEAGCRP